MIQELPPSAERQIVLRREREPMTDVGIAGAVLILQAEKCRISSLASIRSLDWLYSIIEAMRPGVAAKEAQATRIPLFDLCLQRVVVC